jgi:cysteine desulfurase
VTDPIYLDNNATTRPLPEVVEAIAKASRDAFANPGSRHAAGRAARRVLEASRETVARVLDGEPDEVVFTSGGTESINLALFGLARGVGAVATPPGEHPATAEAVAALTQRGWGRLTLLIGPDGRLIEDQYDAMLVGNALRGVPHGRGALPLQGCAPPDVAERHGGRPRQAGQTGTLALKLVSALLAHNETGVLQDLRLLIDRCNAAGVPSHVDAVQAVGRVPVSFKSLDATALSFGAHKFHGPRGVGGLLVRRGVTLGPLHYGGHQESDRRPGTEPVPLIAGMAKALELWERDADERTRRMRAARHRLETGLAAACPPTIVHGAYAPRLPNTASVAFPGLDGEALLVALDLEGVACSLGSTCASGSAEPAPVLLAMDVPPEVALSTVRFSVSFETTIEEIDEAVRRIAGVVRRLRGG